MVLSPGENCFLAHVVRQNMGVGVSGVKYSPIPIVGLLIILGISVFG